MSLAFVGGLTSEAGDPPPQGYAKDMIVRLQKEFERLWIILALLLAVTLAGCAGSNEDQVFFRGKTVTIIVPHGPGGLDTYARAIAPYFQKYLAGSRVEARNLPGEGGITGRNQIFAAPPDGLTLGFTTSAGTLLAEWAGQPSVHYKTSGFSLIGRINAEAHILVVSPKTGFSKLDDIIHAGKISMGFAGVGSDDYYIALITAGFLGYQVEARTDYLNATDAIFACVKGEVDAILFADSTLHPQIDALTVVPVVVFDTARLGSLPVVPTIFEALPADRQKPMQALVQIYALDRTLFAPPHTPAGRMKVLRDALDKAMADPEFKHDMLTVRRPVGYLTGAETARLLENILAYEDQIKPLVHDLARGSR
jgi:tripartite-type tricarboxylate transporter receptor subunit TctC